MTFFSHFNYFAVVEEEVQNEVESTEMNMDEFLNEGLFEAVDNISDEEDHEEEDHEEDDIVHSEDEGDEVERHKKDLEELRKDKSQAEFLKFLAAEDASLLTFGQDESSDDEEQEESIYKPQKKGLKLVITSQLFESWKASALDGSLAATRRITQAFKVVTFFQDDTSKNGSQKFEVADSTVFNDIIVFCLTHMKDIYDKILNIADKLEETDERKEKAKAFIQKSSKWPRLKPLARTFLNSLVYLIGSLSEPDMQNFVLKKLEPLVIYLSPFVKLQRILLKSMLNLWGSGTESVRILAFFNIRRMAIDLPYPFIDHCLKGAYLTYVRNSKFVNKKTTSFINFLCNCVVELYGIDFASSYQRAFAYIREMAAHLRNAYTTKKEAKQNVYNWQFINSINAWVKLLCQYPQQEHLTLLLHPLVQLIEGTIALQPSNKYFPLRLNCVRMLVKLAKHTDVFIGTAPYILQIFESSDMTSFPRPSTERILEVDVTLKVSKGLVGTKVYQDNIFNSAMDLLIEYLSTYSGAVAFPELAFPVLVSLRSFKKESKQPYFVKEVKVLIEKLECIIQAILKKRDLLNVSPLDVSVASNTFGEPSEVLIKLHEEFKKKITTSA